MGNNPSAPRRALNPTANGHGTGSKLNHTHKRKSLDLPDLAALNITPINPPTTSTNIQIPHTSAIPIPTSIQAEQNRLRPNKNDSSILFQPSSSSSRIYESPPQGSLAEENSLSSGLPPVPNSTPSQPNGFYPQTKIVSGLPPPIKIESPSVKPINVKICWNGGGNVVMLARAGDDDWKGRKLMSREYVSILTWCNCMNLLVFRSPDSPTHTVTIPLLPGTHHLRFFVDNQWLVADDLPTAVDDQGSLANYVGVALDGIVVGGVATAVTALIEAEPRIEVPPSVSTSPSRNKPRLTPGQSFWSASSSGGDDDEGSYPRPTTASLSKNVTAKWTDEIPIELEIAAHQEESFLQATNAQTRNVQAAQRRSPIPNRDRGRDRGNNTPRGGGQTQIINGFTAPPPQPLVPKLPRHLEKLILNINSYPRGASSNGTVVGATGGTKFPPPILNGRERDYRDNSGRRTGRRDRERRTGTALPEQNPGRATSMSPPPSAGATSNSASATQSPVVSPIDGNNVPPSIPALPPINSAAPTPSKFDEAVSADDNSVLPVPSHVILYHLSTSAIKNGVLAVGATTRYRTKVSSPFYVPLSF